MIFLYRLDYSPNPTLLRSRTRLISVTGLDTLTDRTYTCSLHCSVTSSSIVPSYRVSSFARTFGFIICEAGQIVFLALIPIRKWRPMEASTSKTNTRVLLNSTQLPQVLLIHLLEARRAMVTCRKTRSDGILWSNTTRPLASRLKNFT